jgi:hypothetical protein
VPGIDKTEYYRARASEEEASGGQGPQGSGNWSNPDGVDVHMWQDPDTGEWKNTKTGGERTVSSGVNTIGESGSGLGGGFGPNSTNNFVGGAGLGGGVDDDTQALIDKQNEDSGNTVGDDTGGVGGSTGEDPNLTNPDPVIEGPVAFEDNETYRRNQALIDNPELAAGAKIDPALQTMTDAEKMTFNDTGAADSVAAAQAATPKATAAAKVDAS